MTTPTIPQTLGQLIQSKAERFPDAVVLRFVQLGRPDEVVTYGMLAAKAHTLAVTLRHRGLTRGITFAVMIRYA
jgi:acyl-CoA synthetase (AMP-forming)/AMP-acid ligase II